MRSLVIEADASVSYHSPWLNVAEWGMTPSHSSINLVNSPLLVPNVFTRADDRMRRREFITLLGTAAVCPLTVRAQQTPKRIGVLSLGIASDLQAEDRFAVFQTALQQFGRIANGNITFEFRYAEGKFDRLAVLADELVRMNVDIILTSGTESIAAARQATSTIPIVMVGVGDPVGAGFVASLVWDPSNGMSPEFSCEARLRHSKDSRKPHPCRKWQSHSCLFAAVGERHGPIRVM
jgi:hypothetical protein